MNSFSSLLRILITVRRYASTIYAVIVCPSVCLSQVGSSAKLANSMITQTTPYDSPDSRRQTEMG